jgi:hypothetical protein
MAKRKNVIAPNDDDKAVEAMDLVKKQDEEKQIAAREAIAAVGFDLKEYDLFTYIQTCRNVFRLHKMTGIMGGKFLLAIKENEQHGTFMKAVEEIGIAYRTAARYMHYAKRFGKYDNLSHLSQSELSVLEDFTDPELEKLDAGEEVRGLTLDEYDKMTAAEARDKLRENAKKLAAQKAKQEKVVKEMSAELEELRLRDSNRPPPTKEQIAQAALFELNRDYTIALAEVNAAVRKAHALVVEAEKIPGVDALMLNGWFNQYSPEMSTFAELHQAWTDEVDEAAPIEVGKIKEAVDVSGLG